MTDNEIIKALKMWLREGDCNGECPLLEMGYCFDCACVPPEIASGILDLINRQKIESNKYRNRVQSQKGEITRLHKKVAELTAELEEQKAEITVYKVVPKCTTRKEGAEKALEEMNK